MRVFFYFVTWSAAQQQHRIWVVGGSTHLCWDWVGMFSMVVPIYRLNAIWRITSPSLPNKLISVIGWMDFPSCNKSLPFRKINSEIYLWSFTSILGIILIWCGIQEAMSSLIYCHAGHAAARWYSGVCSAWITIVATAQYGLGCGSGRFGLLCSHIFCCHG